MLWPTVGGNSWSVFLIGYLSLALHLSQWLDFRQASLGEISYSIYFIHYVVLFYLMTNNLDGNIVVGGPVDRALINTVILLLPTTVVFAWLSFRFIEQPFLSLRGRYLNKGPRVKMSRVPVKPRPQTLDNMIFQTAIASFYRARLSC